MLIDALCLLAILLFYVFSQNKYQKQATPSASFATFCFYSATIACSQQQR